MHCILFLPHLFLTCYPIHKQEDDKLQISEMPENILAFEIVPPSRFIRFGPFELDTRSGELRKHGIKVRLPKQTFQILMMLLKHPGEVVLREEIRDNLWPGDTVVEFEHSINAAIQKLRDALGESAGDPKYIETLPRRGYRFIGTVEKVPAELSAAKVAPPKVDAPPEGPAEAPQPPQRNHWTRPATAIAGLAILAAAAGLILGAIKWIRPGANSSPARNFTLSLGSIVRYPAQLSPDGSAVIYATSRGVVLRRLDALVETPLYNGDRLIDGPAWSSDGSQIIVNTLGGLVRMRLPDGQPTNIWPKTHVTRGYSWGPGGVIITATIARTGDGELYLVPADGGEPALLEVPAMIHGRFFQPEFLPDGDNVLFAWSSAEDNRLGLYLATLRNGKVVRGPFLLRRNVTAGHYSPAGGGRLLYVDDDKLYAQALNIRQGRLEGEPELVVEGVHSAVAVREASFSVSRTGVLAWKTGRAALAQLTWFDRTGKVLGTPGPVHVAQIVHLSPDEKHIIIPADSETAGYSIVEANQTGHTVLPGIVKPVWMPDSSNILYSQRDGNSFRVLKRAAAGGPEQELARIPEMSSFDDVTTDGKFLLYRVFSDLYAVGLDGSPETAKPRLIAPSRDGKFSPDGHWVVYAFNTDTSKQGIYVQPFPSGGLRTQIPSAGGLRPVWRGDGKEILFLEGSMVYSVAVETRGGVFDAGAPRPLFKVRVPDGLVADSAPLAVSRDGSRILFAQGVEQPDPQLTYVMTAWDLRLKR